MKLRRFLSLPDVTGFASVKSFSSPLPIKEIIAVAVA